jgi:uncharacterized membrane protein YphA (DoxX/SURF4 family)
MPGWPPSRGRSSAPPAIRFLGLCAAYIQGGLTKLTDFPGAVAEMTYFGLPPAPVFAVCSSLPLNSSRRR